MEDLRTGLSYGDVLLVPQRSPVESRRDVDLQTPLTFDIELDIPLLSSPMDTITEAETAIALSAAGGCGVIHRFMTVEEQAAEVAAVHEAGELAAAAVGIAEAAEERTETLIDAGAACIVVDVAHGHLEKCLRKVERLRAAFPEIELVAGNVATAHGTEDLCLAGVDAVKVGIGPGSHCTTRKVAGAGVPQLTAVHDCEAVAADYGVPVIADGGIRSSGDAVKALMAGASSVMMGSLFAGTAEAPPEIIELDGTRYKRSRGMATTAANEDRSDKQVKTAEMAEEGVEAFTEYKGPLAAVVMEFTAGIRSGLSYCGGNSIDQARANAEFIRVGPSAKELEGAHGDHDWEIVTLDS